MDIASVLGDKPIASRWQNGATVSGEIRVELCSGCSAVRLGALTTQTASFALGQSTPNSELFSINQGVFQTVHTHYTTATDFFGFASGRAALGEEKIRINA